MERLFAWHSRCRRLLNTVFDCRPDLFAAHVWIVMIFIIARRLASVRIKHCSVRAQPATAPWLPLPDSSSEFTVNLK